MKRSFLSSLLVLLTFGLFAQEGIVAGDILVMMRPNASVQRAVNDLAWVNDVQTHLRVVREVSAPMRAWLLHYDAPSITQAEMLRSVQSSPLITLAQNNHRIQDREVPNDTNYGQQWHHQNIDSEAAWDISTGGVTAAGDTIVVAIIENSNLIHPDLIGNAWFNYGEVPGNGIDDDGNGYVDDYRGWSAPTGDDAVYGGPHGTEVAGMIGAKGNNGSQVVGANWNVKMMAVPYENTQEANVIAAYTYPLVMRRLYNSTGGTKGAFVVVTNASWGIDNGQPEDSPLWCAMYDTLGTAGVLNCGATANNNVNVDVVGDLPTACPSDFMISVTATNNVDVRTFSGYGATTIDVGAPGQNVVTTSIDGSISTVSGTSFASPLTAGVIALLYSVPCPSLMSLVHNDPTAGALYVRHALFSGVEQVGNLPGNTVTGGRINSYNSMQWLLDSCSACPAPYNLSATSPAIGSTTLGWSGTAAAYDLRYRAVGSPTWTTVNDLAALTYALNALPACVPYEFQVASICDGTEGDFSASRVWTSEGCCTAPIGIAVSNITQASATAQWATVLAGTTYTVRYRAVGTTAWTTLSPTSGTSADLEGLQPCTDFEVEVATTCSGSTTDWSAAVTFHVPGCGQCVEGDYCPSEGASSATEWIAGVTIGTIDHVSGNDGGYANATTAVTTLDRNGTYPVTLTPGYAGQVYAEYFTVWLDLDQNGQFTAPEELMFDPGNTTTAAVTGSLTVPATALLGPTRLRVIMHYGDAVANGCTTDYDYGETEDYCVNVDHGVGISESAHGSAVVAYPDPADEVIHFTLTGTTGSTIIVLDNAGREVVRTTGMNGKADIATDALGEGLYLYRVTGGSVPARGSFIVVH